MFINTVSLLKIADKSKSHLSSLYIDAIVQLLVIILRHFLLLTDVLTLLV